VALDHIAQAEEARGGGRRVFPRGRARWMTFAVAPLAVLLVAPTVTSAGASPASSSTAAPATTTYYAVGKPVCQPATAHRAQCYAMRRVEVKEGTPGARAYEVAAGARGGSSTIGPAGGLTPGDLGTAYGVTTTGGTGQTVAVVDAYNDPDINTDLQTFDSQYGLATCSTSNGCLTVLNETGGTTLPANDTTGWSVEETLDVEAVHSVCQGCNIILLEANSQSPADLATAVNTAATTLDATEISNSYGFPESTATTSDVAAYNHPGVVITASTGDDGYYDFDYLGEASPSPYNQDNFPAAFNTVIAVGGTSLYLSQTGTRQSETVWNDDGPKDYWEQNFGEPLGAGGGGCSTTISAQKWQTKLSVWSSTGCGTFRSEADIAADADYLTGLDIYDTYSCASGCISSGWITVGGTSLSSPIISSLFALAGGAQGVNYPALTLYGHLGSTSLYDVTTGGNGYCDGEGAAQCGDWNLAGDGILDCDYPKTGSTPSVGDRACDALKGYDGPTGVGTPQGLGAFAKTGPTAKIAGPKSVTPGTTETWTATTTDPFPAGTVTSYSWNWGDGTAATVTTTGKATHDYATGGVSETITLTVTDNYGAKGSGTYGVTVT